MSDRRSVEIALLAMWKPLASVAQGDADRTLDLVRRHYLAYELLAHEIVTGAPPAPAPASTASPVDEFGWYKVLDSEHSADKIRVLSEPSVGNRGWFTIWASTTAPAVLQSVRKGARVRGTLKHDGGSYWTLHGVEVEGVAS
tara:strand:- start:1082 stop:1507 length:426 start_codon:yes stop_codon:yes gene_type:complete